jgi:hypothetical protein
MVNPQVAINLSLRKFEWVAKTAKIASAFRRERLLDKQVMP